MDMRRQIGPEGRGRPLIVALDHVDAGALPLVGGKAANLGELIAAGLPVPAGFCVTTEAYRDVARLGRKTLFMGSVLGFTVASALCGIAPEGKEDFAASSGFGVIRYETPRASWRSPPASP